MNGFRSFEQYELPFCSGSRELFVLLLHSLICHYSCMGIRQSTHVLRDSTSHRSISLTPLQWSTECKSNASKDDFILQLNWVNFARGIPSIFQVSTATQHKASLHFERAASHLVCSKPVSLEPKTNENTTVFSSHTSQGCLVRKLWMLQFHQQVLLWVPEWRHWNISEWMRRGTDELTS